MQKASPGICEISGADSPRKWDELDGYGLSGARLRYRGLGVCHFSAMLSLYTEQDWSDWEAFEPLVKRAPLGKFARAMDIYHPLLQRLDIKSVVVENEVGAVQSDDGVWTIEIKFIEFRKPKLALATPDGAAATPADPYDVLIGQLNDQANDLAAKADAL